MNKVRHKRIKNKLILFLMSLLSFKPRMNIACWAPSIPPHKNNLGDDLNVPLVSAISGKYIIPLQWSIRSSKKKSYSVIGSIIPWWINDNTYVWGSGIKTTNDIFYHIPKKVFAVRGPLTRQVLLDHNIECPEVYGDPALLAPLVYYPDMSIRNNKLYKFGIILHENDYSDKTLLNHLKNCPDRRITLIDICHYSSWKNVIDSICQCQCILSSSLHGLILADAYRIPSIWCRFRYDFGDGYVKFHDYFMTVGRDDEKMQIIKSYDNINSLTVPSCNSKIDIVPLIESCPFSNNLATRYQQFLMKNTGTDYIYAG